MKLKKPHQQMNAAELAEATKEFDREFVADTFGPLSMAGKAAHHRAGAKIGRPRSGKGSKRINITLEQGLLQETDRLAKRIGVNRSRIIAQSLAVTLARKAV
jgi:membrane protein involved in colicin uptake